MISQKMSAAGDLGVLCRKCQSPMRLNFYPLLFLCDQHHRLTLEEVLHHDLQQRDPDSGDLPWSMLKVWEQRARKLHEISGCAFVNGHSLIAADFLEAAHRIEDWMSSLSSVMARRAASDEQPD